MRYFVGIRQMPTETRRKANQRHQGRAFVQASNNTLCDENKNRFH